MIAATCGLRKGPGTGTAGPGPRREIRRAGLPCTGKRNQAGGKVTQADTESVTVRV